MENYSEWLNNKMYQGHVRRLTQIKAKQNKTQKTQKNFRIKSQPTKSQINVKKNFFPLPLVSKNERQLLGTVVRQKTMNLRQKQQLLENYMLSKRILQTNSVFDSKLLKKQFNFHRKVSQNMNRSLMKNRQIFSELRKKQFSQLQKSKQENYLGIGKVRFQLKLQEILLIKRKFDENNESRFNLIYKPQKLKSYTIKALTFSELFSSWHNFKATEKQSERKNGLKFQIEQVRGNDSFKLCEFRLHLSQKVAFKDINSQSSCENLNPQLVTVITKNIETRKNKQFTKSEVQKLLHPLTKSLIGTIQFKVKYQTFNL